MSERCVDHGEDEAPRMCECTREKLTALRWALRHALYHCESRSGRRGKLMGCAIPDADWKRMHALVKEAQENPEPVCSDAVVCDHAWEPCRDEGCQHAVPHKAGQVESLNGLNMGDCSAERREHVCCVAKGTQERIRCVRTNNGNSVVADAG
jgi:hypothetical protein